MVGVMLTRAHSYRPKLNEQPLAGSENASWQKLIFSMLETWIA